MHDVLVFSKNRWSFGRFIEKVNRILDTLSLGKAEDKTFIGKIERGFDFLGFYFGSEGMTVSKKSVRKFAENVVLRLGKHNNSEEGKITPFFEINKSASGSVYNTEQLRGKKLKGELPIPEAVSVYVQRWLIWVKSIYGKKKITVCSSPPFYRSGR